MTEKTPKFNKKIEAILKDAQAGEKICQATGKKFKIRSEDLEFYRDMNIPLPIFCPGERLQRVIAHCPSLEFFMRKSDLSGKEVVSNIDPESPLKIYANDEYWSDQFDAAIYGRDYKREKSFFEQLYQLRLDVPQAALFSFKKPSGHNEFSLVLESNNCYRTTGGPNLENVLFCNGATNCRDCAEIYMSDECELCYQMNECQRCYSSSFLHVCSDCIDCHFGYDLKHCEKCFGCNNLRYKKYCFFNEQLTQEEYDKRIAEINLGSRQEQRYWLNRWLHTRSEAFRLDLNMKSTENCVGSQIVNCQNCFFSIKLINNRNVNYSFYAYSSHDVFDTNSCLGAEKVAGSLAVLHVHDVKYSFHVVESNQVEYSEACQHVENCFGCIGLRNKRFHILNKPYSESDYWKKIDEIKTAMLEQGEYGHYPSFQFATNAYNLSFANFLFPISKEQARDKNIRWYDLPLAAISESFDQNNIPDDIKAAGDEIIGRPIACRETGRLYSIVKAELDFYRRINVPLPDEHHWSRWAAKNFCDQGPVFISLKCQNCQTDTITQNFRDRKEKLLCKACYNKIVEKY